MGVSARLKIDYNRRLSLSPPLSLTHTHNTHLNEKVFELLLPDFIRFYLVLQLLEIFAEGFLYALPDLGGCDCCTGYNRWIGICSGGR